MENTPVIPAGSVWAHYKGRHTAIVLTLAKHTETGEDIVIYICFDKKSNEIAGTFARPLSVFTSTATNAQGAVVPRFTCISKVV